MCTTALDLDEDVRVPGKFFEPSLPQSIMEDFGGARWLC
jgi:hypothetical protein